MKERRTEKEEGEGKKDNNNLGTTNETLLLKVKNEI
jgi:hypothetical protein